MKFLKFKLILIFLFFCSFSSSEELKIYKIGEKINIISKYLSFEYDNISGKLNVFDSFGNLVIRGAYPVIIYNRDKIVSTSGDYEKEFKISKLKDCFGKGKRLEFVCKGSSEKIEVREILQIYEDKNFFTISTVIKNTLSQNIEIEKIYPLVVYSAQGGGIFLGNPKDCQILENGYNIYFDFYVRKINGAEPSFSNWNSAIYNLKTKKSFISGFLKNTSLNLITTLYEPKSIFEEDSFTTFIAECQYEPSVKLERNKIFSSDVFYINFLEKNPLEGLENFAECIKKYNKIKLKKEIPVSWNSWGTMYHKNISEKIIEENLQSAEKLKKYGVNYFVIDDGYQISWGDWEPNEKFLSGMENLLKKIKKLKFKTGIWVAPFCVEEKSSIYRTKKDWVAKKDGFGRKIMSSNIHPLDLSRKDVEMWLRKNIRKFVKNWGVDWLKLDFTYYLLGGRDFYNKNMTKVQIYQNSLRIIKEEAKDKAFLVGIGACGLNYGLTDGMRISLDNKPVWGERGVIDSQGILPTMQSAIRRYYLNKKVFINHNDLIFFSDEETLKRWDVKKPLSLDEIIFTASGFGLLGGIFKIGDAFVNLKNRDIEILRKIIPHFEVPNVRPIDLFTSEYPEIWDLKIKKEFGRWDIVGLFNWDDKEKEINLNFEEISLNKDTEYLVFEFWEEKFLGEFKNNLSIKLRPRSAKIISIHPKIDENNLFLIKSSFYIPKFISINSHITQGATDIKNIEYKLETSKNLFTVSGYIKVIEDTPYNIYFYVPEGFKLKNVEINLPDFHTDFENKILKISFKSKETKEIKLKLFFSI
jgi:hypothetical protein